MELIEIIKLTVSIFAFGTFVLLSVSYLIYRLKDRSRIKPYMNKSVHSLSLLNAETQMRSQREKILEQKNSRAKKFNVMNESVLPLPAGPSMSTSGSPARAILRYYSFSGHSPMYKLRISETEY